MKRTIGCGMLENEKDEGKVMMSRRMIYSYVGFFVFYDGRKV
jgi:hypothetical protein